MTDVMINSYIGIFTREFTPQFVTDRLNHSFGSNERVFSVVMGDHHFLKPESYYEDYEDNRVKKLEEINCSDSRFVPISDRENITVLSTDMIKILTFGKYQTSWKGIERVKSSIDIIIYEELIWNIKPKTIIEFGAYKGGSALWMADLVRSYGLSTHVYSLDINLSHLDERAKASNLTFIEGDSTKVEETLPNDMLKNLPHPWLLVEDAHINVGGILEYLHGYIESGDYLIIDDTNPKTASTIGMGFCNDSWIEFGNEKMDDLRAFMSNHLKEYAVDAKYTDMFGYNACYNSNGYIKRL